MLANTNAGTIKNVNISGQATSTRGAESDLASAESNGVGGLVGLNDTTGKIEGSYSEATIQAKVGGGGFAAINKGEIKTSYNRGIIGLTRPGATDDNSVWLSNTINYSVMGGIAGINFGSILASQNKSYVFAPALNTSAQDYVATMKGNDYIGGIAGYNKANATISECSNNYGFIDDDTTKNYLVFGDQYIGNIAGWNDGAISYSMGYAKIGARSDLGGITSSNGTTGTVKNCGASCTVDRGDLGTLADTDAAAAINFYVLSTSAENSAYNNTGTTRGVIPGDGTTYVNCVTGFKNGSNISILDTLNKGTELSPKWMYISSDTSSANPAIQPIANAVATLTTVTGDAANLKVTTYGLSKFGEDSVDVQPNGNAPEGYTFAGWALTPNGEILTEEQSLVITWTLTAGQNIVVYAVYTENA